jgi:arginine/ornithine N-succinyltransferase beta subunit
MLTYSSALVSISNELNGRFVYKTFVVCNNCTELSQRLISLYNAGAEKFNNTCNKRDRKRKRNLNIITARNQVP